MQRIMHAAAWAALTATVTLCALAGSASAAEQALAPALHEKGHACSQIVSSELESVDRTGAIYRVACHDGGRYAVLVKTDGFAVVVPEIASRHPHSR